MKLRKLFLCLVILFAFSASNAQTYKDTVKTQFLDYTALLIKHDFVKSTEYLHPEFFKLIPKEQMIALMEQTFNNPEVKVSLEQPFNIVLEENKVINKSNYVKFRYDNYMQMQFPGQPAKDSNVLKALGEQFGEKNVTYDDKKNYYRIFTNHLVVASSADRKNWTFVVIEEASRELIETFIPKELF